MPPCANGGLWVFIPCCLCAAQWRAAGVLVYDFDDRGEMQLLLARQESASSRDKKNRFRHRAWNILGAHGWAHTLGSVSFVQDRAKVSAVGHGVYVITGEERDFNVTTPVLHDIACGGLVTTRSKFT